MKRFIIASALLFATATGAWAANVTTPAISSVVGQLPCYASTDGLVLIPCGIAAISTIPPRGILANPTAAFAAPTAVIPTGTWGVPVLSRNPILDGGQVGFHNTADSTNPSRLTFRDTGATAGGNSSVIQTEFKNGAGSFINGGSIKLYSDVVTTGSETSHWLGQTIQAGVASNEWESGGGFAIGTPSSRKGTGTLVVEKGIYAGRGTVAALPTCNAGAKGELRVVNDANSTTFNAAAVGGGANAMMALCDGATWRIR